MLFHFTDLESGQIVPQVINIKKGESVPLRCDIEGFPVPVYSWYLRNRNLHKTTKSLRVDFMNGHELDSYKCKGKNVEGSLENTFHFKVLCKFVSEKINCNYVHEGSLVVGANGCSYCISVKLQKILQYQKQNVGYYFRPFFFIKFCLTLFGIS